MITAHDIDIEQRKIAGRPYVVKFAIEIETGEAIWTRTENGYELWHVEAVNNNSRKVDQSPINPLGVEGFIGFSCKEGVIMHEVASGVYVDIKKGK